MAITHFIDTSLPEIARSRVKSLTNRVTEAFPVLVYGDTRNHNFVFHNAGTVESFSGGAGYSLRVTLGAVQMGPTKGSYVLTCGSSVTVDALSDASTIQAALNGLTTITSDGGVVVTGTFPNFLVTWNTVGVKTAFTVDASLCIPQTGISLVTTQTGSASVVNQVAIVLRQAAISSQSTWTVISSPAAGWTGTITTNSAGALLLLNVLGQSVGNFIEANTVLTAEVLDSNSVPISYYQTPIILRAKNLDPSASVTPPLTTYTLGDMLYGNASGTLTRLAGNTTTTPKVLMQTGTGAVSAAPVWSTASTLIDGVGSTQGSLIYRGASTWAALTPGSAGAILLSGGAGANPAWSTDLTYSTPTLSVPDAFNISSEGSITLTAGGTNKDITFTPSGTGRVIVPNGSATLPGLSFVGLVGNTGLYWTGPGVLGFSSAGTASLYFNSGGIVSGTSSNSLTLATDGSIALTAGGSNKNVTITPSGTGSISTSKSFNALGSGSDGNGASYTAGPSGNNTRVRMGNSRLLNFNDGLFSFNLGAVSAADTYQTLATGGYAAMEFYNIASGRQGVRWIVSSSSQTGSIPFTPSYAMTMNDVGDLLLASTTVSSSQITGAFRIGGNVGFSGNAGGPSTIGGTLFVTQEANTSAAIWVQGGAGNSSAAINIYPQGSGVAQISGVGNVSVRLRTNNADIITYTGTSVSIASAAPLTVNNTTASSISTAGGLTFTNAAPITGGAGNMTITAGTGNSRTLTLQTTTSGGTATNAVVFSATQAAAFTSTIATAAGVTWDLGALTTATVALDTTRYIAVTVGGAAYKLLVST